MSRSRAPILIATAAAGGVGYYLYSAGGSPKVAQKEFESDAHKAAAKIRGEVGHPPHVEGRKEGIKLGKDVGAKIDNAMETIDKDLSKAKHETESYAKSAKAETLKKIDEIDRKVEEGAAKSKGYLSSWFGSK
ncbi:hypothetical protein QBC47DRAFT_394841 [Echria macrotheca]|uniref:Calcofluor white hypersensitive protein n=1 Tax=Echria macrotheca TaxID=438768 RepID=A0AAJ0B1P5_9PEZI|nr:hypothetical protein QBC47DRAFT_394841 [Echria macrotheca]